MATPQRKYPIVKYLYPSKGEENLRFLLKEDNGDRVVLQLTSKL